MPKRDQKKIRGAREKAHPNKEQALLAEPDIQPFPQLDWSTDVPPDSLWRRKIGQLDILR
jgi:hypothetical protein